MPDPVRGDIWLVKLIVALPITTRNKNIPFHVEIAPPEGGLKERRFIKCEDIRSISKTRLSHHLGSVSASTLSDVEDRLRILLNL